MKENLSGNTEVVQSGMERVEVLSEWLGIKFTDEELERIRGRTAELGLEERTARAASLRGLHRLHRFQSERSHRHGSHNPQLDAKGFGDSRKICPSTLEPVHSRHDIMSSHCLTDEQHPMG